jgi:hypothetical protein
MRAIEHGRLGNAMTVAFVNDFAGRGQQQCKSTSVFTSASAMAILRTCCLANVKCWAVSWWSQILADTE